MTIPKPSKTQLCPNCFQQMEFIPDKKNSKNPLGYMHKCDNCKIQIFADETGQNKFAEKNKAFDIEHILNSKYPGLSIIFTETTITVKPLPNIKTVANQKTVLLIWLLAQFQKENPLQLSQTNIAEITGITKMSVHHTFKLLQQAGLLKRMSTFQLPNGATKKASWHFSHKIDLNTKAFRNLKSTRGQKSILTFS